MATDTTSYVWLYRNCPALIASIDADGRYVDFSEAYLRRLGFRNVYHLEGGILNYLEHVDPADSLWQGDCFVFDNRVSVDHELREGDYEVCPACRMPLTEADRAAPEFEPHVSCPKCFERLTPEKREGLLERARQIELAAERGEKHEHRAGDIFTCRIHVGRQSNTRDADKHQDLPDEHRELMLPLIPFVLARGIGDLDRGVAITGEAVRHGSRSLSFSRNPARLHSVRAAGSGRCCERRRSRSASSSETRRRRGAGFDRRRVAGPAG